MSSQAQAGPSVPQEKEKKGFGKFLSRAKTILKKGESSKSKSGAAAASATANVRTAVQPPKATAAQQAAAEQATSRLENPVTEATKPAERTDSKLAGQEGVRKVQRKELFEERARKLGEKYGLEIKQSDWFSTEGTALRVEKPIRMRVHRNCVSCNAAFSSAKECPSCGSTKSKRYPPKRTEAEKIASRERRAAILKANKENPPIVPDYGYYPDGKEIVLKKPSKCGGQDLVHKKPRQRIRRTCHECQGLFIGGSKECAKCGHIRCTDCPRDPPKKDKYPFGYPGDVFGPNAIPHHECHECRKMFPGGVADGTACLKCQHPKCADCPRLKPRKVEPEPDPDVLRSVQAKLDALKIS
ncbi:hypothetical protein HYQ45_008715 [Verticillium longisporum]|uniref:Uncharacterized protein n=2 Tax=Verticillium TaxID=1036719 RepID=A0A8I2ZL39_VERLO|nr:hypothetical protein VdG1_07582 [Verticillium dahliae VDG1]KAG7133014.1 hypothetical protein HYQ45_008715 [Verticillium longisporum]PNH38674.1 hypothetical protein VD0004_g8171 [Verticillium dahliae]PNH66645.1 hypothetical protein VD0001_g8094 [Verticillium dahliae]RBQ87102.1 hypothetical protein VDGD_00338 [Verticillium dahliae]